ncbi:MAG TPA: DNA-directed RNA polymerase subunit beta, partial [bacterium]|nr:DNA-directed RNA polymerase subunit beta [bacterium]
MAKVAHLSKGAERKFFAEQKKSPLPDLIEVQKRSYRWFTEEGLRELFEDISPIKPFSGDGFELSFLDYYLDEAKFDEKTSRAKNLTYEAPLRVQVKLLSKKNNKATKQEVYLGDFPLMTDR